MQPVPLGEAVARRYAEIVESLLGRPRILRNRRHARLFPGHLDVEPSASRTIDEDFWRPPCSVFHLFDVQAGGREDTRVRWPRDRRDRRVYRRGNRRVHRFPRGRRRGVDRPAGSAKSTESRRRPALHHYVAGLFVDSDRATAPELFELSLLDVAADDPPRGAARNGHRRDALPSDFGPQLQAGFLPLVGAFWRGAFAEDLRSRIS